MDPHPSEWALTDAVTHLREWGSERTYALVDEGDVFIGTTAACAVRLKDPTRRVSRYHARLARTENTWFVRDLSLNGTRLDGARRSAFLLHAGNEIGVGPVTLVAESPRWIALRRYVARLLGWSNATTIDQALRAIRLAITGRIPLIVCADADPTAIAHGIHLRALGGDQPFIACDPRREAMPESVRSARNIPHGMDALDAAEGGSLCLATARLPKEFTEVLDAVRTARRRVALFVCTSSFKADVFGSGSVSIPSLDRRRGELMRIVEEYEDDVRHELSAPVGCLDETDRIWIAKHAARSLGEIETATTRLTALRMSGNVNRAAARLGMAHVSLTRWIERRRVPWKR